MGLAAAVRDAYDAAQRQGLEPTGAAEEVSEEAGARVVPDDFYWELPHDHARQAKQPRPAREPCGRLGQAGG